METYYVNPALYKLTDSPANGGISTGSNLIKDFSDNNVNMQSYARTTVPSGKWGCLGYDNSGKITRDYGTSSDFSLANPNGDYDGNGTVDVFDYVIYKKVRLTTPLSDSAKLEASCFTGYSKDCDGSGNIDAQDFEYLRDLLVG